jgi:hypothetical protein
MKQAYKLKTHGGLGVDENILFAIIIFWVTLIIASIFL